MKQAGYGIVYADLKEYLGAPHYAVMHALVKNVVDLGMVDEASLERYTPHACAPRSVTSVEIDIIEDIMYGLDNINHDKYVTVIDNFTYLTEHPEFKGLEYALRSLYDIRDVSIFLLCRSFHEYSKLLKHDAPFFSWATMYDMKPLPDEYVPALVKEWTRQTCNTLSSLEFQSLGDAFEKVVRSPYYTQAALEAYEKDKSMGIADHAWRILKDKQLEDASSIWHSLTNEEKEVFVAATSKIWLTHEFDP